MANKFKHSRTTLCVGYTQNGDDYEGGNCEHLKEGERAHGRSQEIDSMGSESYLMCRECYEKLVAEHNEELVRCNDCLLSFKRSQTITYTPYEESAEPEYQRVKFSVCKDCQGQEKHLDRLRHDNRLMDKDLEEFTGEGIEGFW